MSRIGRMPVTVPAGVTVTIGESNELVVKGPKGTLTQKMHPDMQISQDKGVLNVTRPSDNKLHRSLHGLTRTLVNNMVVGVTTGYTKGLEIVGVGYRAQVQGKKLVLTVGYSHPVEMDAPEGISFEVQGNKVLVHGIDKQLVGAIAANIRSVRKPEPYHGKGIRYENEVVRRKEGKTGKK